VIKNLPFFRSGPDFPLHPVIISVPHAGRDYPEDMTLLSRLDLPRLIALEDRFADCLVREASDRGFQTIIARTPRAWIDLNRSEQDFDPDLIQHDKVSPFLSAKVRGGLGIIPRRIQNGGDIWRGKIGAVAFEARLADFYRPYHDCLAAMIVETRRRFGIAVLLDLHSMPPLAKSGDDLRGVQCVVGDRYGQAASSRFSDVALSVAKAAEIPAALNAPYAGGYILERHCAPQRNIHGLQIEVDRTLYLDDALDQPGRGRARIEKFVAKLALVMADEARGGSLEIAAE
jgi:N-formylglutamate amidohydrolase